MSAKGAQKGGRGVGGNKKLNIILVLVIALLALGSFAAVRILGADTDASSARVVVKDADGETHEYALAEDQAVTISSSAGTNVVEIADGRVRVREADCPNQDCVNQGWIKDSSQQIVCLPHKLTVDIVDDGNTADYDVVGR